MKTVSPILSRKRMLAASSTGIAALVAAACSSGDTDVGARSATSAQPATVQWYKFFNATDEKEYRETLEREYKIAAPNVTIDYLAQPPNSGPALEQLIAMTASGSPPDVLWLRVTPQAMVKLGWGEPIDDLIRRDRFDTRRFNQRLFQIGSTWQGKTYGLPYTNNAEASAIVYHRELLRAAGVPEPPEKWGDAKWTWEHFIDAARRVHKLGADGKATVFGVNALGFHMFLPRLWGGAWVTEDHKTITCERPEAIEAYEMFYGIQLKHRVWPQPGEAANFLQHNVAFSSVGAFALKQYAAIPDLDWALAPFPKAKFSSPQAYVVNNWIVRGSRSREPAWGFVKWLTERSRLALLEGRPSALLDDLPRWLSITFKDKPAVRPNVVLEGINVAVTPETLWMHQHFPEMNPIIVQDFQMLAGRGEAVAPLLQNIKPRLQRILDRS